MRTIGKLTPFIKIILKFSSMYPIAKKAVMTSMAIASPVCVQRRWKPNFLFILSNQSVGGKTNGVSTVKIEKLIVGDDK